MGDSVRVQNIFLLCVASVYLIAFVSLFIQIPGLYGNDGVLPARLALNKDVSTFKDVITKQPTLIHLLVKIGIKDIELAFNLICFVGVVISFLAFVKSCFRTSFIFLLLWMLYQSLFQVGQTFLWFQWDTLLLELGFLVIFVAPIRLPFVDLSELTKYSRQVSFWLVRWMTFRFMFSSGVVKLNSQCPTWWGLTAMTYHYESQCIPTPLSWYAHQMPLWFQRASTAFVFVIQIVSSILFFSPFRLHRIFSFFIQSSLMVMILLSGNYNFFNWVSIVMCMSLVDDRFVSYIFRLATNENQKDSFKSTKTRWTSKIAASSSKFLTFVVHVSVIGTVCYVAYKYFHIRFQISPLSIASNVEFSYEQFQQFLGWYVPLTIWVASGSLAMTVISCFFKSTFNERGLVRKLFASSCVVAMSLVAITIFSISLVPYTNIHQETHEKIPQPMVNWYGSTNHLSIINAYGLFRRMTGVGGRPEVIVEGSDNPKGGWKEFNFLYKPGDVDRHPPFVAPHQPRLDWQMWFAALGRYDYNPWFYHLVYRILTHEKDVLALMDKGPFDDAPPKYLRALLFHYHFTGWNDTTRSWWRREYKHEYMPVLSLEDEYLMGYVRKTNLYVDPLRDDMDYSSRSLTHYFFKFLHSVLKPRLGFEICVSFIFVGIFVQLFSRERRDEDARTRSWSAKQKFSSSSSSEKLFKQS